VPQRAPRPAGDRPAARTPLKRADRDAHHAPRTIGGVPRLRRPDGAEIEWRLQGEEVPLVAIARAVIRGILAARRPAA
jgi:hypothetical protein